MHKYLTNSGDFAFLNKKISGNFIFEYKKNNMLLQWYL